MYIHLGQEAVVKLDEIIGIFDLEKTSLSKNTKMFLSNSTKKKQVITVSYEMPKSFVVVDCTEKINGKRLRKANVYISQISCSTLKKRSKS